MNDRLDEKMRTHESVTSCLPCVDDATARPRARRALEDIHEGIVGPRPSASIARESDGAVDEDEVVSNPRRDPIDDADADTERVVDLDAARAALTCVITNAVFVDPVTTPCGHTFEREALARWITRGERERLELRPDWRARWGRMPRRIVRSVDRRCVTSYRTSGR